MLKFLVPRKSFSWLDSDPILVDFGHSHSHIGLFGLRWSQLWRQTSTYDATKCVLLRALKREGEFSYKLCGSLFCP